MHVVPLEVLFEDHQVPIRDRRVHEVVHQQVEAHAWRETENGGQPQGNRVGAGQKLGLRLDLRLSVERDGLQGRFLGAEDIPALGPIAAVGGGIDHALGGVAQPVEKADRVQIDGAGSNGISVAGGSSDNAGQRNQDIRLRNQACEHTLIPGIPMHKLEPWLGAQMEETPATVKQVVQHRNLETCFQQALRNNGAEVAGPASDEDTYRHARSLVCGCCEATA
ncbi:hypothetical protein GALL_524200 [mine drainage metagenome]|uniref:Uncharacterized protein n=1 Tax=mine drainage metagenome TaxID=410659 RepID=A0A1J5P389_9ZZZZ